MLLLFSIIVAMIMLYIFVKEKLDYLYKCIREDKYELLLLKAKIDELELSRLEKCTPNEIRKACGLEEIKNGEKKEI